MIRREPTKRGDMVRVTFELPADAQNVFVVGDFNSWCTHATPMKPHDGVLRASLTLAAGRRYAFRYYRDGEWFNDPAADDYAPNAYSGDDGVVDLSAG